eukprot:9489441-Pyramimonas_sp.AAC.1
MCRASQQCPCRAWSVSLHHAGGSGGPRSEHGVGCSVDSAKAEASDTRSIALPQTSVEEEREEDGERRKTRRRKMTKHYAAITKPLFNRRTH